MQLISKIVTISIFLCFLFFKINAQIRIPLDGLGTDSKTHTSDEQKKNNKGSKNKVQRFLLYPPDQDSINLFLERKKVEQLNVAELLSKVNDKKILVLAENSHGERTHFIVKHYIIEELAKKKSFTYLDEASIFDFYYFNAKKIHASGKKLTGYLYVGEIYFGYGLGNALFDSLERQGNSDSINVLGFSYHIRNREAFNMLFNDLDKDASHNTAINILDERLFLKRVIDADFKCFHNVEAIYPKYLDSIKVAVEHITFFYDHLIKNEKGFEEKRVLKMKQRMWVCVSQDFQDKLYERSFDQNKLYEKNDITEITKWNMLRDKFLYSNIAWYINEYLPPNSNTVIGISAMHALKSLDFDTSIKQSGIYPDYETVGMFIQKDTTLKNKTFTIALVSGNGYTGISPWAIKKIKEPPSNSIEKKLSDLGVNILYYNLKSDSSPLFKKPFYMSAFFDDKYLKADWSKCYDGFIFIKDVLPNVF